MTVKGCHLKADKHFTTLASLILSNRANVDVEINKRVANASAYFCRFLRNICEHSCFNHYHQVESLTAVVLPTLQ